MIEQLILTNFRNYPKRTLLFPSGTTLIVGANAAGKTNILESIYLLATGKSFRADRDNEMIAWGNEVAFISGELKDDALEIRLTSGMVGGKRSPIKNYRLNGNGKRMVDFVGKLKAVLFWPEDLELISDSPSRRRKYLDFILMQTDREYRRNLNAYEKAVRSRNRILEKIRDGQARPEQLLFWNHVLIKNGQFLTKMREAFIDFVNQTGKAFADYRLVYDASCISESRLAQYAQEEVAAAVTLVGPHRDDVHFYEGKRNLSAFGSRGEQRLCILWLKLAEIAYIKKSSGEEPLLLLDDIFSELDLVHRDQALELLHFPQVIITATDAQRLPKTLLDQAHMIQLTP